ncbi:hypothetical protein GNI_009470 [Gregarina niphandrodes]|uniref:SET domain-containing protein n=1 Tax=Gregarina niphandrodes TaxID=110365 RepID=A0A023BCZ6_GRENI|nr:hypothetical protein GNI_009470 [Gregarina niphandrodes]EZG86560.1 hypothetical protein GNI_009470 [Gregarina niphandrodes]|eukprot:XP_011128743.1 hypothetical protein GNI_009470 [Gregarina niphandrodes]
MTLTSIKRPPLPGEEYGEGQSRVQLKKSILEVLGLPVEDAWLVRNNIYEDVRNSMNVWLASDNELYSLQWYTRCPEEADSRQDWVTSISSHNHRKSLIWLRSECVSRIRLAKHALARQDVNKDVNKDVNHEVVVTVGWYQVTLTELLQYTKSELEDLIRIYRNWLVLIEEDYKKLVIIETDDPLVTEAMDLDHCIKMNVKFQGVEPRISKTYGRCLITKRDLKAGDLLISMPESSLINSYQALYDSFNHSSDLSEDVINHVKISEAFIWSLLLGGRYLDNRMLTPPEFISEHSVLGEFLKHHEYPDAFVQEQLFLILFVAWEALKGPESKWYPWLSLISGYEDCIVEDGYDNLLITKHKEVIEFLDDERITQSVETVTDCIQKFHQWVKSFLGGLFPKTFEHAFDEGKLTEERLLWACWVCESREFETLIPVPLQFISKYKGIVESEAEMVPLKEQFLGEFEDARLITMVTSSAAEEQEIVPELKLLPDLHYLTEEAFGGSDGKSNCIILPIRLGWDVATNEPVDSLIAFSFRSKCLTIMPIIDYINHSRRAQCSHPGFHDKESKRLLRVLDVNEQDYPVGDDLDVKYMDVIHELFSSNIGPCSDEVTNQATNLVRELSLRTNCDIPQGQQVFINYGPHEPWSFLRYYGFIEPGHECITLLLEPEVLYDEKTDLEQRSCMLKVFKVPEEHLITLPEYSHGKESRPTPAITECHPPMKMMLAAARILTWPDVTDLIVRHSEDEIKKLVYSQELTATDLLALELLIHTLNIQIFTRRAAKCPLSFGIKTMSCQRPGGFLPGKRPCASWFAHGSISLSPC